MEADPITYENALKQFHAGKYGDCIHEFNRLSKEGHAKSSFYVGAIYVKGGDGVLRNEIQARSKFKQALAQSEKFLPGAALWLALMQFQGIGGAVDYASSLKNYQSVSGNPFAKVMIGVMKSEGKGCTRNEDAALQWFDRAWALGHPLGLREAARIRFRRGHYIRGAFDFSRAVLLIIWFYGIRRIPKVESPNERLPWTWRRRT